MTSPSIQNSGWTSSLRQLLDSLAARHRAHAIGWSVAPRAWALAQLIQTTRRMVVCVSEDNESAEQLAAELTFFLGEASSAELPLVLTLPDDEVAPWDELVPAPSVVATRLNTLYFLSQRAPIRALVLPVASLIRKTVPRAVVNTHSTLIAAEQEIGRDTLVRQLSESGYRNSPLVEDVGTFSVRGDIVDVFPPGYETPVRLNFFGDFVESIRTFDERTQRTVGTLNSLRVTPARELMLNDSTKPALAQRLRELAEDSDTPTSLVRERIESIRAGMAYGGIEGLLPALYQGGLDTLMSYFEGYPEPPLFYIENAHVLADGHEAALAEAERSYQQALARGELTLPPAEHFLSVSQLGDQLATVDVVTSGVAVDVLTDASVNFTFGDTRALRTQMQQHRGEEGAIAPLLEAATRWHDDGYLVAVACGSLGHVDRLHRMLDARGAAHVVHRDAWPTATAMAALSRSALHLYSGDLREGFTVPSERLAVLSAEDVFGSRVTSRTRRRRGEQSGTAIAFRELKEGDFVVHSEFGVAKYAGLKPMVVHNIPGEFLVLEYAGKDKVYLPVSRMGLISKYGGPDTARVSLDKLGTTGWERTTLRAKEHILKMAAELLALYAARRAHAGHAFSPPDGYFRQFEADFEFDETPDQQKAIDDVLADMQRPTVMDRLVCGDVGYGKTEVAIRATFKAVLDRKQVAVLVPTTLLAHQHHRTFSKRLAGYPVTTAVVSGLSNSTEARETIRKAHEGRIDVLIGTHKLLGTDVSFKDLGLVIIDEEQRFGVKQKEHLKKLRNNVDVLVLSATPIPRTLNMAMSGLRDMSLIATPPTDRRAIRTFVNRFNPELIREAITRELARGGQVFFVHNRVQSIRSMEKFLCDLLPGLKIGVAHGQMGDGQLEQVMFSFIERKIDVLLSTSIIESGLDIGSANTLIVNRADNFGLSQLYQLRGRVGRAKERAYAYLLVPARQNITADAQKRLEVLQSFSELGAGFSIASHDLDIRGAGNLLGPEQSGAIEAVGFELYTQMLEETAAEMRGEPPPVHIEPEVNLPIPALLPESYVADVHSRLMLYKRLSSADSPDQLADLRAEIVDRYGDTPDEVDSLFVVMELKQSLRSLRLRALDAAPGKLVLQLGADALLDASQVATLVQKSKGEYRLTPDMKLVVAVPGSAKASPAALVERARQVLLELRACLPPTKAVSPPYLRKSH